MTRPRETAADRKARVARLDREAPAHFVWSDPVEPDVPVPERGYTEGWAFVVSLSSYSQSVAVHRAWSEPCCHGTGRVGASSARWSGGPSQGGVPLYSSEARALRAARAEACRQMARVLLDVDERIAAAGGGQ